MSSLWTFFILRCFFKNSLQVSGSCLILSNKTHQKAANLALQPILATGMPYIQYSEVKWNCIEGGGKGGSYIFIWYFNLNLGHIGYCDILAMYLLLCILCKVLFIRYVIRFCHVKLFCITRAVRQKGKQSNTLWSKGGYEHFFNEKKCFLLQISSNWKEN